MSRCNQLLCCVDSEQLRGHLWLWMKKSGHVLFSLFPLLLLVQYALSSALSGHVHTSSKYTYIVTHIYFVANWTVEHWRQVTCIYFRIYLTLEMFCLPDLVYYCSQHTQLRSCETQHTQVFDEKCRARKHSKFDEDYCDYSAR